MNSGRTFICTNDLIDCIKRYKAIELKIFYNMLYTYKEQTKYKQLIYDYEDDIHLDLNKFDDYLGKKHLTEAELTDILCNLPKGIYSKDKKNYISVFEYIRFDEESYEYVFKITDTFKPLIEDVVKEFTVLELQDLSNLNSVYSQRLFEFASKNKNLTDYKMKIDDFRNYFQIPITYKFGNIDQKVINPMVKEVNTKTNFNVSINKIKSKNKVTHILFKLGVKKKEEEKKSSAKRKEEEPF